jgi:hypothetical protein
MTTDLAVYTNSKYKYQKIGGINQIVYYYVTRRAKLNKHYVLHFPHFFLDVYVH